MSTSFVRFLVGLKHKKFGLCFASDAKINKKYFNIIGFCRKSGFSNIKSYNISDINRTKLASI